MDVRPKRIRWLEILETQVIRLPAKTGRRGGAWALRFLLGIGLLAACALFASWVHVQNIRYRYRLSQAYAVQDRQLDNQDALLVEKQMLRSPRRILRIAEQEMGLVLPEAGDRTVLR